MGANILNWLILKDRLFSFMLDLSLIEFMELQYVNEDIKMNITEA